MDDSIFDDDQRSCLVASLALRVDWLRDLRHLHLYDRTNRCYISHFISCGQQSFLRHLGLIVAGIQSSGYGLYLVRRSVVDWRYAHLQT